MTISDDAKNQPLPRAQGIVSLLALSLLVLMLAPGVLAQVAKKELPPIRPLRTGGLKAEVAALIMSGQEGGAIPLEVLVLPIQGAPGKVRVPLVVEMAGGALVGDHPDGPFRFEIYAYAISATGGLEGSLLQTFEVDLERLDPRPEEGGIKFSGEMQLPPGEYSLRVLVRRSGTESVGMRVIALEVPGGEEQKPVLLAPLVAEAGRAWLELTEVRGRSAPRRESLTFLSTPPAAKAVILPDHEISFRLLSFHLESVGSVLKVELADGSGRQVAEIEAQISSYSLPADQGFRVLEGKFRSDGLVNGEYQLKVVLNEGEARLESPTVSVVVLEEVAAETPSEGGSARPSSRIWPQVTAEVLLAGQTTEIAALPGKENSKGRRKKKRQIDHHPIIAAYERSLGLLAEGQEAKARTDLFRQSVELVEKEGSEGLKVLSQVQILNAKHLAEILPEALLPVALLHHELYRYARRRNVALISTHARTTTLGLAELYVEKSKSASAKNHGADLFASIGGALLEAELFRFSERLFLRALELEDAHPMSLLGLGMSYEKIGEYEGSIDFLNELVEAHPEVYHGRLRLAINLNRIHRRKAAARHLRQALKSPDRWVKSLAYQELARLHLQSDELEEAQKLLRKGVQALPGEGRLYILLAFVLDAQQQSESARKVLEEMELKIDGGQASARHLYNKGTEQLVDDLRRGLREQAEVRYGDLHEALVALEGRP
jgi:tetratricopeptide (TPR) repeat protein